MNINQPSDKYIVIPGLGRKKIKPDADDVEKQAPKQTRDQRLRGLSWMPNKIRNHLIAALGEFCGTFLFLFFAFSATQVANTGAPAAAGDAASSSSTPNTSNLTFIALAFGFSLAVNVWVFFRISGGLFNPAVTLGMCLIGAIGWTRGAIIFATQIIGGIASAAVVAGLFPNALAVRTQLRGTSITQGLFIEMFLTTMLVFTVFMLAAEKHKGTFLAPIGIGLALFIAELSGVWFTGGSLNPARSFGPDVVLGTFDGYHWIYWVGPALGSLLAVVLYRLIKSLEYETANPGQDFDENEMEAFDPGEDPASPEDVRRPQVYGVTSADEDGATTEQLAAVSSQSRSAYGDADGTTAYAPSSPRHSHDGPHHSRKKSAATNGPSSPSLMRPGAGTAQPAEPPLGKTFSNTSATSKQQQQQQQQPRHHRKQDSQQGYTAPANRRTRRPSSSSSANNPGLGMNTAAAGPGHGLAAGHHTPPPPAPVAAPSSHPPTLPYPVMTNGFHYNDSQGSFQEMGRSGYPATAAALGAPSAGTEESHGHFPHERGWYQGEDDEGWQAARRGV